MRKRYLLATIAMMAAVATTAARQMETPSDWRWRTDAPATLVQGEDVQADAWRFVAMPPGWHVTTGPGALLYHPGYQGRGTFSVEAEIFLFPGVGQEEYGVFLGGRNLGPSEAPAYIAFVARRDGSGAVLRGGGASPVVEWTPTEGILAHAGEDAVRNILRVDVNAADVVFGANGTMVVTLPRAGLDLEGQFGFRIGQGLNVHASRLDVTHRLAPVPIE